MIEQNLLPDFFISNSKSSTITTSTLNTTFNTSSFVFDEISNGLKNTQQIKIDYSKFENHTFFNSAVAKLNLAFEKIINKFPYDGSKEEIKTFYDNLNGFEKYFIDSFPHNFGFLNFHTAENNFIVVNDFQGINDFENLSKQDSTVKSVLSPEEDSFTIEFHFRPPSSNQDEIILQKMSDVENLGYCVYTNNSASPTGICKINLCVFSGSINVNHEIEIERNKFSHISFVFDNSKQDYSTITSYLNGNKVSKSQSIKKINDVKISKFKFLIGNGTQFIKGASPFVPTNSLSGSLDELRYFSSIRTDSQIKSFSNTNVFGSSDLKLYYKFNESDDISNDPSNLINGICLDSSGNSLHSYVENFDSTNRSKTSEDNTSLLTNEKKDFNKILFPGNSEITTKYTDLLTLAKEYDKFNPNLITKLIPKHYLIDGQLIIGTNNIEGEINEEKIENISPGNMSIGNVQLMVSLLYTLASFYDELKQYIDSVSSLDFIRYEENNNAPDIMLERFFSKFGFDFASILNNKEYEKYFFGEYTTDGINFDNIPLKEIQFKILRNVAANLKNILSSKGTIDCIKYFIRSLGLDPDTSMHLIEYGSSQIKLEEIRQSRKTSTKFLKFELGSYITSSFLVEDRIETDGPSLSGTRDDDLLTSGSWCIEANYKYNYKDNDFDEDKSSLIRLYTTGQQIEIGKGEGCVLNLIANESEKSLNLIFNPISSSSPQNNVLTLNNVNVFDGERWNIAVGRTVNYSHSNKNKYFIKAGRLSNIDNVAIYSTSSYFDEIGGVNVFNTFSLDVNDKGLFIASGDGWNQDATQNTFVQDDNEGLIQTSLFRIQNLKFWTKELSDTEFFEHTKSPLSVGDDNFVFNSKFNSEASYERLRANFIIKHNNPYSDEDGGFIIKNDIPSDISLIGANFTPNSKFLLPDTIYHTIFPLDIDSTVSKEKVFLANKNVNFFPEIDNRFEIQINLINYLNEDVIKHLSSTKPIENTLGNSEFLFDDKYSILEYYKYLYFNRIKSKINFKYFYNDIYKFISQSLEKHVSKLLPEKTQFLGVNFIIQSHLLERHKINYKLPNFYLNNFNLSRNSVNQTAVIQNGVIES